MTDSVRTHDRLDHRLAALAERYANARDVGGWGLELGSLYHHYVEDVGFLLDLVSALDSRLQEAQTSRADSRDMADD